MVLGSNITEVFGSTDRRDIRSVMENSGEESRGGNHYFSTQGTGLVRSFDFSVEGTALIFAVTAAALRAAISKKEAMNEG